MQRLQDLKPAGLAAQTRTSFLLFAFQFSIVVGLPTPPFILLSTEYPLLRRHSGAQIARVQWLSEACCCVSSCVHGVFFSEAQLLPRNISQGAVSTAACCCVSSCVLGVIFSH